MEIFVYAVSLLIAGLLAHAGISKLLPQNQHYYTDVIQGYGVPKNQSFALPRLIGLTELVIAILVLTPQFTTMGLTGAAILFAIYLIAFIKQLAQGKADANCGCAGPGANMMISPMLLLRNTVLISMCLLGMSIDFSSFSATWFIVIPLAISLGFVYHSCEQLIVNQQKIQMLHNT